MVNRFFSMPTQLHLTLERRAISCRGNPPRKSPYEKLIGDEQLAAIARWSFKSEMDDSKLPTPT